MGTLGELLATPDAMRITTPLLQRETVNRILEIVRKDVAEDKVRIDTPTQNLESYFLGVVQKARQNEETSGATSGNRVAPYLRGDADQPTAQTERLLERLTLPTTKTAAPDLQNAESAESVDHKKLEELTRHRETAAPAEPAVQVPGQKEQLEKANEKLSSLLSGKDSK